MSNTRRPRQKQPAGIPDDYTPPRVPSPDELTLGDNIAIRMGTGIDVLAASYSETVAACLWFVARHDGLTWEDCLTYKVTDLDLSEPADEKLPADEEGEEPADPTHGSGTRSSES